MQQQYRPDIDQDYLEHQRGLRRQTDAEREAAKRRPDGPAMRALRVFTYIVVSLASLMAMIVMIKTYLFLADLGQAVDSFVNGLTTEGILGN